MRFWSGGLALTLALAATLAQAAPGKGDVVAFGLWGEQSVFASEAAGAAGIGASLTPQGEAYSALIALGYKPPAEFEADLARSRKPQLKVEAAVSPN